MARSRNIKPGFFTNDELAELPALTRLLFIGLWTLVDRDGRIEDRPKKIKAECMPYDDMDADAALSELCRAGFILRYEADNTRCIQVQNWSKHQNPHVKELASTLPAPDKHQTSTVPEPVKPQPQPEPAGLIPDSSPLIPDSQTKTARKRAAPAVLVSVSDMEAEGVNPQHAADWLVVRKTKDSPLTPTAWEQTKAEAVKAGLTIGAAIQTAAANGWAGFKASWLAQAEAPRGQAPAAVTTPSTDKRADAFLADQDQRAAAATRPPSAVLELARKAVRTA
jgi:hypothetical protein